jgi:WD40 repeat protein
MFWGYKNMKKTIFPFGLLILILIMFSRGAFAKAPLNSHCVMDSECESNICNVVTDKCINKGPINSTCGLDSECESNMCNTITLKCTNAELEARGSEVQWLMNLVKKNTGKAFCVPKGTKLREGVAALTKFSKAHPEAHDPLTDEQAIQALAESFPCTVAFADQSPTNDEERRIIRLVNEKSGIAFCVPKGTKLREGVAALTKFSKAHPEIHGQLTDEQAIQALTESFPCTVAFADQFPTNHEERKIIRLINEKSVDNSAVDWSPDGKLIATAGDPMQVTIWDSVSLSIRHQLNQGIRDWGGDRITFSPDSQYLASGLGAVNVWNVANGTLQATLVAPHITSHKSQYRGIESLCFSPDGRMLVVVYTGDKQIVIAYRIADGKVAWTYEPKLTLEPQRTKGSPLLTTPLVFTPDGKRVIFCTGEWGGLKRLSRILLLDAESGKFLRSIDDIHMNDTTALALSRDGKWVATGTSTGEKYQRTDKKTHQVVTFDNNDPVRIWDVETGELVRELPVHSRVWSLAFSRDGKYLFGATRNINVWNAESGKMVQEISSNPEPMSLALSPNGKRLAAACQNKLSIYEIINLQ